MVELRGRLRRHGWFAWIARLLGHDARGLGGYAIDWDEGVIRIDGRSLPLSEVRGVWLTRFSAEKPDWGTVELTIPGGKLGELCSRPFDEAEAFAAAVAQRCGCPLHRTN